MQILHESMFKSGELEMQQTILKFMDLIYPKIIMDLKWAFCTHISSMQARLTEELWHPVFQDSPRLLRPGQFLACGAEAKQQRCEPR